MKLTVGEITEATGGRVIFGNHVSAFTGVSIDSRSIGNGELFVPLKGEKFDGHDFLKDALNAGGGALVSMPPVEPPRGKTVIFVRSTLKALQDMAQYVRKRSGATVVGITGTNGKTTTKELIASILGVSHRVLKNSGNLNNHIGLPLSLIKLEEDDEFAVLEMGASIRGDIRRLCDIAVPDLGVITNIGMGHIEGFGSIEGVRSTKLELFEAVKKIALNCDDSFLMAGAEEGRAAGPGPEVVTFGIENDADVYADEITLEERRSLFTLRFRNGRSTRIELPVPGRFNIYNALAAASVCDALAIPPAEMAEGIRSFTGIPMRLELKELRGATVISDVYNANPVSMEEAVKELVRIKKTRAIAVLGDMLELGPYAEEAHRKLGSWMAEIPVDIFIAVGPLMEKAAEAFSARGGMVIPTDNVTEARRVLLDTVREGDTVLVKGSRGTSMERVLEGGPEKFMATAGGEAGDAL